MWWSEVISQLTGLIFTRRSTKAERRKIGISIVTLPVSVRYLFFQLHIYLIKSIVKFQVSGILRTTKGHQGGTLEVSWWIRLTVDFLAFRLLLPSAELP